MLCPLRFPLQNNSAPTQPCSDNLCSDDCQGTSFRMAPFGVRLNNCGPPDLPIEVKKELWEEFTIVKTLTPEEKSSASNSVISFAIHNETKQEVAIKAYTVYQGLEADADGLYYEMKVYEALRQLSMYVPHFTSMLASYSYTENLDKAGGAEFVNAVNRNTKLAKVVVDIHNIAWRVFAPRDISKIPHYHNFMVTTRAPGITIEKFFNSQQPVESVISVLFQILFCLHVMSLMGFQHNDLHSQNIFVDTKPNCSQGLYVVEQHQFLVPLPAKITIYDFDLSSCGYCGRNPALDTGLLCTRYGVCNERNIKFDMYTIFRHLQYTQCVQNYPDVRKFFLFALGTERITEKFTNRMCNLKGNECSAFPLNDPATVRSPIELLLTQFSVYRVPV